MHTKVCHKKKTYKNGLKTVIKTVQRQLNLKMKQTIQKKDEIDVDNLNKYKEFIKTIN